MSSSLKQGMQLLRAMTRIRMVEEEIARRYPEQEMRCPVHLSIGQEAAAVGICAALKDTDWTFSGHRNHAHYLAKGGDLKAMLAEIYGKATGCCGGKGGSMHLTDRACGFIGATPIVGSTVPIAVGAALTAQREGKGRVVVVFLGDGAMEAGVVHESLNFAALKSLPILFACENNLYSVYSPLGVRQPSNRTIGQVAAGHGVEVIYADGNNVDDIYGKARDAVEKLRVGGMPVFMEMPTYRWREHCGPGYDNNIGYRSEQEFLDWKENDPLRIQAKNTGFSLDSKEISDITLEINSGFEQALIANFPDAAATGNVYAQAKRYDPPSNAGSREISYAEALLEAQDQCLGQDLTTYLMGLGVPDPKGIFGTTLGLQEKHGKQRVFDIPLAENALTGVAIGTAITGLRPILTHQRVDFALVSIDQVVNQAAKWHYMFNGTMSVPMVIRMIIGRGWGQGPQHSQSLHAWFGHIPGLKVIMPTTAFDAKGMLISAIEDDNPVLCLEHRWLYNVKDLVPTDAYRVPLGKARVVRMGTDVTLVGISYMTLECLKAADELQAYGIHAEVVDLRSIRPIDDELLIESVNRTKRLLVVDHADPFCGVASEIVSLIAEKLFSQLISAPEKLALPSYPAPTSHSLADDYYPISDDIVKRVLAQMKSSAEFVPSFQSSTRRRDQPNRDFQGPF
ncbi:alpha-ketoacid dehydrogenase subunit alpha/beta [Synechococcus sp. MIT S9508]|uniref:dehydrogenase E1 component subunit alpha/beta n=1 Tax=Synechococcus sp. MIT S9508 TaxID=1801629 RepID=UPI0007BB259C|nr:alpha-ketoacid dehydrogenase subunit alpha/beta [Synechococcus sp. MIT S9508]KZR90588.1 Acetoin:2,6-dichlorophenolindophenol oxidoreductase subunit beta [Synechococcus sp. MIT S9508]